MRWSDPRPPGQIAWVAALLLLAGCGDTPERTTARDAVDAPPEVELLDPGAEPRAALRLSRAPGHRQTVSIFHESQTDRGRDSQRSKALRLEVSQGLGPGPDLRYDVVVERLSGLSAETSSLKRDPMDEVWDSLAGTTVHAAVTDRGLPRAWTVEPAAGTHPFGPDHLDDLFRYWRDLGV